MLSGPPRLVPFVFVFAVLCLVWWYLHIVPTAGSSLSKWTPGTSSHGTQLASLRGDPLDFGLSLRFTDGQVKPPGANYTYKIVIGKTEKEDIGWMEEEIPDAPLVIYEVDNPNAKHKIPKNKGREAMACHPTPHNHARTNTGHRSISATSSTTTMTFPTRASSCTLTATHGTTTCFSALTAGR